MLQGFLSTADGMFRAAPELAMAWAGFDAMKSGAEEEPEDDADSCAIMCPCYYSDGACCLICSAAAKEVASSCSERNCCIMHVDNPVRSVDGMLLRYQLWAQRPKRPSESPPVGSVLILHDLASNSTRACRNLVPHLLAANFVVASFDMRAHGRSTAFASVTAPAALRKLFNRMNASGGLTSRRWGGEADAASVEHDCGSDSCPKWRRVQQRWRADVLAVARSAAADCAELVNGFAGGHAGQQQRAASGNVSGGDCSPRRAERIPLILLGDGFGGALALDFVSALPKAARDELQLCGVAASGALLGLSRPDTLGDAKKQPSDRRRESLPLESLSLPPPDFEALSRDLRVGEMARRDALRVKAIDQVAAQAAIKVLAGVAQSEERLCVPLAFFHGSADRVAPLDAVREWIAHTDAEKPELHVYQNARHWLHHEVLPEREDFLHDLTTFLRGAVMQPGP